MSAILIADCGSTKIRWAEITDNQHPAIFTTPGVNPVTMRGEDIQDLLHSTLLPQLGTLKIEMIHFYGAGCATPQICSDMGKIVANVTGCNNINVHSDLLGAARALCGHSMAIACILGTGSNSCLFDGTDITEHVSPLGYILGDEGSGAVIGRSLIGNILKRQLPEEIIEEFNHSFNISAPEIIDRVYRQPSPNTFLASFMPFVAKHITHPAIEGIVIEQFILFFKRNILNYSGVGTLPIHFTGSVAHHFAPQLHKAAAHLKLHISSIVADPLPQLLSYHKNSLGNCC